MAGDDTTNTTTPLKPVTPIAQYQCPKLKTTNYTVWAIQIKVILEAHDLWEAIEPKENTQVDDKKDKATTAFLYQALTEDVILQVAGCKTAKELWESLKTRHVGEERVQQARLQSLMIGFQTLQMKEDDTMDAFTAKLNGYATKAKELGKTLDESLLVRKLLDSTPDRFIQIVASIEQTNDLDNITLDEIVGKLKAFEERIKLRKGGQAESQESLLFAHGEHSRKGRRFKVLLNEGQIQPEKYATTDASIWYLDNGASNHMTGTKSHFRDIDESTTGRVRFGDGSYVEIKGRGSILLGCKNNEQKIVSDIYCIPNLRSNILSLGQLTEIGCKIIMDGNKLTLYDKNKKLLIKVERSKNRLYSITLQIEAPICLLANVDNQAWLWHARLSHLNFDDINKMTRKGLVEGIPRINHAGQICDACLLGKHSRTPFPNQAKFRSKNPLDLVYGDLCGPISPATHSGKKFIFLDVRFMETKPWDWDNSGEEKGTQDTFWASFVVDRVDNENPTPVNTENNDNTYQEHEPITYLDSPITPRAYTYNPNSEEEEEATISSLGSSDHRFDDTPKQGFKDLTEIYQNAREVETETLLFTEEEP
ncbi:zinc finger, CCHC-type containing protein [Tanacetum coccineum]